MKCQNCGQEIHVNDKFFRAGKNGTVFCSKDCSYEAFEGFYSKKEIDKTLEHHTYSRKSKLIALDKNSDPNFNVVDPEGVLEVAKILEIALTTEPPYVFTINDEKGEYQQIGNREMFLEHYLNWAMEKICDLVDIEE